MILGTNNTSMFIPDDGNTIILNYSLLYFDIDQTEKELKSEIDGTRHFVRVKDNSEFDISLNLYKEINQNTVLLNIYKYKGQAVRFYPFMDGKPLGNKMYLKEVNPIFITGLKKYDILDITFKTTETINLLSVISGSGYGTNYGHEYGVNL